MIPPAPAFASTTNDRPRSEAIRSVTSRVTRSTAPPGGNGVSTWTGRSGYCAKQGADNALSNKATATAGENRCFVSLPRMGRCLPPLASTHPIMNTPRLLWCCHLHARFGQPARDESCAAPSWSKRNRLSDKTQNPTHQGVSPMFVATASRPLATTITGSLPRPRWYVENLGARAFLAAFNGDAVFREQYLDAVA